MAGEWFAVDCCLETKPETVEILVATGEPVDVVIGGLSGFGLGLSSTQRTAASRQLQQSWLVWLVETVSFGKSSLALAG